MFTYCQIYKQKSLQIPDKDFIVDTWKKINDYSMGFIKRWLNGYLRKELEQKYNYLNHQKIMPNMSKLSSKVFDIDDEGKKILANQFEELIYKLISFEGKCDEYMKDYIIPILEKEENIIFDISSTDENIQFITQKTLDLFLKYIREQGSMTFHNPMFVDMEDECERELYNLFNFLYIDNLEVKEYIAKSLCDVFIKNYKKIDLTQKNNTNIRYLYLFTPYEWGELI